MLEYFKEAMNLEEEQLVEMAFPIAKAKEKVKEMSATFNAHWAYFFVMKDDVSYKHWRNEIASYCEAISKIKVKPKNNRLDRNFLVEELLYHIDTDNDAQVEITSAWAFHASKTNPLPSLSSLNLTEDVFREYRIFRNRVNEELEKLFTDSEEYSKEFYQQFIDRQLSR